MIIVALYELIVILIRITDSECTVDYNKRNTDPVFGRYHFGTDPNFVNAIASTNFTSFKVLIRNSEQLPGGQRRS